MTDAYRTVAGRGEARFEVNGSTFIAYVAPVDTVEEAESFIESVHERHPEARHVVPAYRVPAGSGRGQPTAAMLREWCSDDGEPSGSSGKPALNVLVQQDIQHVAVAVARYKSGPNLGVGGLARAYSQGVKGAVEAAGVVEEVPHERLRMRVEYDDSGTVRGALESAGVEFEATYDRDVRFDVRVAVEESDALCDRLRSATSGRIDIGE